MNDDSAFSGEYVAGKREGKGKLVSQGFTYEGDFSEDKANG